MSLEEALQEHEEKVDALRRQVNKYAGALKAWKRACQVGNLGNLQKAAAQAEELSGSLPGTTAETRGSWDFDARAYLENGEWLKELQEIASERFSLRTLQEKETLISSPVTVRAQPSRGSLQFGKINWPSLRPKVAAAELKRLRDRTESANSQEFVESLYGVYRYLTASSGDHVATFRKIYDLFCLTPGYKKENPPAAFGQQIYALHRSKINATRGGHTYEFEFASGNVKERQIYTVIAEDGRSIRYYGIWFK